MIQATNILRPVQESVVPDFLAPGAAPKALYTIPFRNKSRSSVHRDHEKEKRWAMPQVAIRPANVVTRALEGRHATFERLWTPRAKCHVPHAGCFVCSELERVVFRNHPNRVDRLNHLLFPFRSFQTRQQKNVKTFVGLWSQQLDMSQMCQVKNRLAVHSMSLQPLVKFVWSLQPGLT